MSEQLLTDALRNTGVIIELSTSALGLTRLDKGASQESEASHQAVKGAAKVSVSRLPGVDDRHREIIQIQNKASAWTKSLTMPWGFGGGRRFMPNSVFEKWVGGYANYHHLFQQKVAEMMRVAPQLIADAHRNIGQYNVTPPTLAEMQNAYRMEWTVEPIADGGGFSPDMTQGVNAFLARQFNDNVERSFKNGQQARIEEIRPLLTRVLDRMESYEDREKRIADGEDPGAAGVFRDSLVTNIQDAAGQLAALNVTNDPNLQSIADRLSVFNGMSAKELRERPGMRAEAKTIAKQAVDEVDAWLAGL